MINETRVNLKHLLEDIRDSYSMPIEEIIVTELVANALDSRASRVDFFVDKEAGSITCVDNGSGMKRPELREYHNIAATTKERGKGIGFAGVGAKLSLLVAENVVTETKGGRGSRAATDWSLASDVRAPWKFTPVPGLVNTPRGTAVKIFLHKKDSSLLEETFIEKTITKHFYPLLSEEIWQNILRFVYKNRTEFFVNGEKIAKDTEAHQGGAKRSFFVFIGSRNRRPVGYGYLMKLDNLSISNSVFQPTVDQGSPPSGIALSTHGKVVKRGWEWLGVLPKSWDKICGTIEIPGLAEVLTTNKTDFLSDSASLKKYYRFRKAVQEAVVPILRGFGEERVVREYGENKLKPLEREVETVLGSLLGDFPELQPFVHMYYRRGALSRGEGVGEKGLETKEREEHLWGIKTPAAQAEEFKQKEEAIATGPAAPQGAQVFGEGALKVSGREGKRRNPGLSISFEEDASVETLGRLVQNTVFINTIHPAWQKAKEGGLEEYHILHSIAWALSNFIEPERSPQDFVSRFLLSWGRGDPGTMRLFEK